MQHPNPTPGRAPLLRLLAFASAALSLLRLLAFASAALSLLRLLAFASAALSLPRPAFAALVAALVASVMVLLTAVEADRPTVGGPA